MADVYLALYPAIAGFDKLVVIKRVLPVLARHREFTDLLLHEARVSAAFSHPNIVQVFDAGWHDGECFVAMEYAHGANLRSVVRRMREERVAPFPIEFAVGIVAELCSALAYVHGECDIEGAPLKVVHRDVSPQNVVVTFEGHVKLIDFGIAQSELASADSAHSESLKGKASYMSPEQVRGDALDERSDIFSTGILLFELVTGTRLFKAATTEQTLRRICEGNVPRPSHVRADVPIELEAIILKALAASPAARFEQARSMHSALDRFARHHGLVTSQSARGEWMRQLFRGDIASHRSNMLDAKRRADELHTQSVPIALSAREPSNSLARLATLDPLSSSPERATGPRIDSVPAAARSIPVAPPNVLPWWRRQPFAAGLVASCTILAAGASWWWIGGASRLGAQIKNVNGELALSSDPPGATIAINGTLRPEVTPARLTHLPTGESLDVKLTLAGFEQAIQAVTLQSPTRGSPPRALHVTMRPATTTLIVDVFPPNVGATFFVDGATVAGPRMESLASNERHTLVVRAPGYMDFATKFSAKPEETKRLTVTLRRHVDATGTPLPSGDAGTIRDVEDAHTEDDPASLKTEKTTGALGISASGGWCVVRIDDVSFGPTPVARVALSAGSHHVTCTTPDNKMHSADIVVPVNETIRHKFEL